MSVLILIIPVYIHRPVVAIIEVEVYRVSHDKRARVRDEVAASLGPPDPTVLVQEKEEGASVNIPQLLETFRKFGDVVLVRVTDDAILVTFKKSTSAVSATAVKEVSESTFVINFVCYHMFISFKKNSDYSHLPFTKLILLTYNNDIFGTLRARLIKSLRSLLLFDKLTVFFFSSFCPGW